MRALPALFAAVFLSACTQWTNLNYEPVVLYDAADVQDLSRRFASTRNAKEFAYEVIQITNYRCDLFFEALDRARGDADFALARVSAVSTGLPPILRAAGVSATGIANVAAALGFVTGTINDAKQFYLLADFKPEIYKKWQVFRAVQQSAIESSIHEHTSIAEAKLRVYEYVRMCLPSQLKQWVYESANSTKGVLVSAPAAPLARRGIGPRGASGPAVRPGPIVID